MNNDNDRNSNNEVQILEWLNFAVLLRSDRKIEFYQQAVASSNNTIFAIFRLVTKILT